MNLLTKIQEESLCNQHTCILNIRITPNETQGGFYSDDGLYK